MRMGVRMNVKRVVVMGMDVSERSGIIAADLREIIGGKFSGDFGRDLRAWRAPSSPCRRGHHVMVLRGKDHLKVLRGQWKHWIRGVKGGG